MSLGLDVVVPTRDERALALRCAAAIERAAAGSGFPVRLLVVDNGSSDGACETLQERGVEVVRSETNLGYAGACNLGAAAGDSPFVLFLNDDAFARPDSLQRLVGFAAERPEVVAAGGKLVHVGTDEPQRGFVVRSFPSLAQQVALLTGLERYWPGNPVSRRSLMLDLDLDVTQEVDAQPAGACLLVRRDAFERVGGFDDGFFFWFEDVDLVLRLRELGRIGYVHDAVFEHVGGASWTRLERPEVIRRRYASLVRFFDKHHPGAEATALRAVVGALGLLRAAAFAPVAPAKARAYLDVVRL